MNSENIVKNLRVLWRTDRIIADIRMKIATFIRRPMTPAIAETVRVQVKLDPFG